MPRCTLLAVGNELLSGEIRDLNLYTLSRRLTRLGFTVTRVAISPDLPESIEESLTFLLAHEPDIVICCGGLGPTEDDLTLRAISGALGRPLVRNAAARRLVEQHYDHLLKQGYLRHRGPEAARTKMATLPEGAQPLYNPIGTAPGAVLETGETQLYVLPGVPAELEAMFDHAVAPRLHEKFGAHTFAEMELRVHVDDEAEAAAALEQARGRHPNVYLKSLAQPFPSAGREGLRIIATAQAENREIAEAAVSEALSDLRKALEQAGLRVSSEEGDDHVT